MGPGPRDTLSTPGRELGLYLVRQGPVELTPHPQLGCGWSAGGASTCDRFCPSAQVVKRSPGSDAGMGLLEPEGCGWLFTDVPSSSEPPHHHACHSLSPSQAQPSAQKTPSFLLPAPLSPAMPLSDEITSAQVSLSASVSWKGWKISQKQGPPTTPGLHTPTPHLRTSQGRKTRLEVGPEKAGPPRSLLSSCQTAPPGRRKGQNLKWTVKSVQPSP